MNKETWSDLLSFHGREIFHLCLHGKNILCAQSSDDRGKQESENESESSDLLCFCLQICCFLCKGAVKGFCRGKSGIGIGIGDGLVRRLFLVDPP